VSDLRSFIALPPSQIRLEKG
jgi:hypothetical protein